MASTMEISPAKLDDLYKGHKVVAMPSSAFGGKTLHEWVSSKNDTSVGAKQRSEDPMHRRSLSAGRAPMRGRDILKETYDRMGITSPRQHPWDDALAQSAVSVPATTPALQMSPKKPSSGDSATRTRDVSSHNVVRDASFERSVNSSLQQRDRKETFHKRYVSAAALSRGPTDTREEVQEEEPRSRSLSRGRYRDWNWPPKKQGEMDDSAVVSQGNNLGVGAKVCTRPASQRGVVEVVQSSPSIQSRKDFRPPEGIYPPSPPCWTSRRSAQSSSVPSSPSIQDEKKESDEGPPPSPKKEFTGTPIKDRISALAATRRNSRNMRQSPPTPTPKSIHPPVIDIYEEVKKYEDSLLAASPQPEDSYAAQPSAELIPHPSPAAVAAASTAADLVRPGTRDYESNNRRSPLPTGRSVRSGGLATAFLAAIQSPKLSPGIQQSLSNGSAPVLEILSNEDLPGGTDNNSVAMSSVSADDVSVPIKGRNAKWVERSKPVVPARKMANGILRQQQLTSQQSFGGTQTQPGISMEAVERMVEERVQARLADSEARSESLLRQLASRLDEKHQSRTNALEAKVEQLSNLIASLWSEQQSHDSGRE